MSASGAHTKSAVGIRKWLFQVSSQKEVSLNLAKFGELNLGQGMGGREESLFFH